MDGVEELADPPSPPPLDLGQRQRIHVVGIGGAGMSAIATVLKAMGHDVTGSDLKMSAPIERLRAQGVSVQIGHRAEAIAGADMVSTSSAITPANPEVVAARRMGVPVYRRADVLAAVTSRRRTVAVAGTKGKTTTASMLALILVEAGMRPSFIVGGDVNEVGGGAAWDDGEWMVVEADESDGTFLALGAEDVLVTNIEPDHLEHYGTFSALVDAFERFVGNASGSRLLCADDPVAASLASRLGAPTYGTADGADWHMSAIVGERAGITFSVSGAAGPFEVRLPLPGLHNARNACGAMAKAVTMGVSPEEAARALGRFGGVARRYQFRGEAGGVTFVDDYAHLPTAVSNVLATARQGGWRRVVAVFQPHRYSRTAALATSFADAFVDADVIVVTEIYGAGEPPRPGVTGKLVVDAMLAAHPTAAVAWLPTRQAIITYLVERLRPGDVCLTLGAGDLTSLADDVLDRLAHGVAGAR